ncbi:MAG: hypothetical protein VB979_09955 [Acinetobacter sp.]|uniref:hypothetical protein n=1 Tax=Acinetobacter sp. TaxID=472 RepID=UPI003981E31A
MCDKQINLKNLNDKELQGENPKFFRDGKEFTNRVDSELDSSKYLKDILLSNIESFGNKWDMHLPVFLTAPSLARILWLDHVYKKSIDVPGRFLEFGSQWGSSLNIFMILKMIYEPWNISRPIVSFSTFEEGFVSIVKEDGDISKLGDYSVSDNWKPKLNTLLNQHAYRSPVGAEKNYQLIEGDASKTFPQWLKDNPEAVISHAHFDMDVYQPTYDVLKLIISRMPKGAILIFDEINCPAFPGETLALHEVLGINNLKLRKSTFQPYSAYCLIE